jgi:hypothetical protein
MPASGQLQPRAAWQTYACCDAVVLHLACDAVCSGQPVVVMLWIEAEDGPVCRQSPEQVLRYLLLLSKAAFVP